MAGKKKTNYISYELKRLELYLSQLQDYLDKTPPNLMVDRIEYIETPRGGTTIKVVASIEQQMKCWSDRLQQLPVLLADVNRLRKEVSDDKKEVEIRGGHDMPGFMEEDNSKEDEEEQEEKPKFKKSNKKDAPEFDNDSYFEEAEIVSENPNTELKELPPIKEEPKEEPKEESSDEEDEDWMEKMEDR